MAQIRVGIIGCGKIAQVTHAPGFAKVPGVAIVALCDSDRGKAEAIRKAHAPDAQIFDDSDALLRSGLDAVAICTPNNLHHPMGMAALEAGLHVLLEKPLAGTVDDAQALVVAAQKAGKVLHVNQSLRYSPPYVTIANLVAEGRIGAPIHARCIRAGGGTPDKGWSPGATWFVSSKHQGGLILDIAVHMADLLRWVMGEAESVAAVVTTRHEGIDVPDDVRALFRYANGGTSVLELSWAMPVGSGLLEIYGTKGRIRMGFSEQPIELAVQNNGSVETTHPEPVSVPQDSFAAFAAAVRGEAPSPTPGELGRDAVALCEAIADAGKSSTFVKIKRF